MAEKNLKFIRTMVNIDILANYISETETTITISDVLVLHTESNIESLRQTLYLYPWLQQTVVEDSAQEITLFKNTIMFITDISDEMKDYHKSMWITIRKEEMEQMEEEEREREENEKERKVLKLFRKVSKNPKTPVH